MRIDSVEVIPYALPFREPYVTARGALERREMVLLRIRDEDGVVGMGEAVPLSLRGGIDLATVVAELESWAEAPELLQPLDPPPVSAPAACAIRTAELDLRARREGVPAWSLLTYGAGEAEPVRCNATLVAGEPAQIAADAERWRDDGFSTFKLKLGTEEDVAAVEAVRAVVGPDARLRADPNGVWTPEQARDLLSRMEPVELELVEEPVATLEQMAT